VFARIIIVLEAADLIFGIAYALRLQVGGGPLEIVFCEGDAAGGELAFRRPLEEMLRIAQMPLCDADKGALFACDRLVGARSITHDERVLAILVSEMEADAVLLHEPTDEIHVAFPVLHAIFELWIALGKLVLETDKLL